MSRETDLELARTLSENHKWDDAYKIADRYLVEDPNDVQALAIMTYIMLGAGKPAIAYHLAKGGTRLAPREAGMWMNLGMAAGDLWQSKEAARHYERGLKLAKTDKQRSMMCINIASILIDTGRFAEGEPYAKRAIEYEPDSVKGNANLGFSYLGQRKFKEGWKQYRYAIGTETRPRHQYQDEPMWDGKGKGNIALISEQGIGDVISFASMIPDAVEWAKKNDSQIIVDCEKRLQPLLQRSFPDAKVYGTMLQPTVEWDEVPDYSLIMGQLGEYYRTDVKDFPGTPYLVPDPDRVIQWKALFESKKKPVIGIAWRGGIPRTGARFRQWDLEQLLPILKSVDAHFVSLQYRSSEKEIAAFKKLHPEIDLVEYPYATLSNDYDDTVAMVACMDHVVTMQTAINHVAGALGVPCWTHVPNNSQWRYGEGYEDMLWAKSIRIIRQKTKGEWSDTIKETAEALSANFPRVQKGNGKPARTGKVRRGGKTRQRRNKSNNRAGEDHASA